MVFSFKLTPLPPITMNKFPIYANAKTTPISQFFIWNITNLLLFPEQLITPKTKWASTCESIKYLENDEYWWCDCDPCEILRIAKYQLLVEDYSFQRSTSDNYSNVLDLWNKWYYSLCAQLTQLQILSKNKTEYLHLALRLRSQILVGFTSTIS